MVRTLPPRKSQVVICFLINIGSNCFWRSVCTDLSVKYDLPMKMACKITKHANSLSGQHLRMRLCRCRMSCFCKYPVALPHCAWVGPQFVIVVFPDHTHLIFKHQANAS